MIQIMEAPVTIALFTDTDLERRTRKIACWWGQKLPRERIACANKIFRRVITLYNEQQIGSYGIKCWIGRDELGISIDGQRDRL